MQKPKPSSYGVVITLLILLLAYGVVGKLDYQHERAQACERIGHDYDTEKDQCK